MKFPAITPSASIFMYLLKSLHIFWKHFLSQLLSFGSSVHGVPELMLKGTTFQHCQQYLQQASILARSLYWSMVTDLRCTYHVIPASKSSSTLIFIQFAESDHTTVTFDKSTEFTFMLQQAVWILVVCSTLVFVIVLVRVDTLGKGETLGQVGLDLTTQLLRYSPLTGFHNSTTLSPPSL